MAVPSEIRAEVGTIAELFRRCRSVAAVNSGAVLTSTLGKRSYPVIIHDEV